jgi:predicted acyltransferase
LYYAALVLIPTPGYDRVMLEPGVNIAHWFDQHFMIVQPRLKSWSAEGFSTHICSIVTGITGMLAGAYLLSSDSWERKVINLFFAGGLAIIAGIMWGWGSLGINTKLWTPPYVLVSSGFAASALAGCIYVIDILGKNKNHVVNFCVIYGMNAIAVFVLADLLEAIFYILKIGGLPLNGWFMHFMSEILFFTPKFASMCCAFIYVFICFIPAYYLYRKKIFIKL